MQIIKMPKPKSCSICCLAMLAGLTFETVMVKIFGTTTPKRLSMSIEEMDKALHRLGLRTNVLGEFPTTPKFNMLCECKSKSQGFWHYIVYDKQQKRFLDPMPSDWPLTDYSIFQCLEIID